MREMKDSGIEWIGQIPKDWVTIRIGNVFSLRNERNYLPMEQVQLLSLYSGKGVFPTGEEGTTNSGNHAQTVADYKIVKRNDIVVNIILAWMGSLGISNYDGVVSPAYDVYIPDEEKVVPHYYHYVFRTSGIANECYRYGRGIMMMRWRTYSSEFKRIHVPFPPLEEQQQIANYLDTQCSEIDATAEDIQKEISLLEEYKKSVITEAVTKGLNPDAEMKDSGIEWVGKVPVTWKIMPNKYIMTKKKVIKEVYDDENIISLSMNGVIVRDLEAGGKMPKTFDGYQIVYPGNLLMCLFDYDVTPRCIGLIKDYGVTSPAYSQFVMNNDNYSGYYYYYYLMIDHAKTLLHLAKNLRHSFTEEQLGAILAPVPTVEEQYQIVNYLDTKCSEIDTLIADKKRQLDTLADYKKSLIYEYVTGKKEVPVNE